MESLTCHRSQESWILTTTVLTTGPWLEPAEENREPVCKGLCEKLLSSPGTPTPATQHWYKTAQVDVCEKNDDPGFSVQSFGEFIALEWLRQETLTAQAI